jgi:hypothetical protein
MRVPPTNNNDERYSLTSRAALTKLPGTSSRKAEGQGTPVNQKGKLPTCCANGVRQAGNSQEDRKRLM